MARGSIRKRGSTWQIRVYGGRDPITGKQRQVARTIRGTKRDADSALTDLLSEINQGKHTGRDVPLRELLDRWWAHASPDWSPSTRAAYRVYLDHRILPTVGHVRVRELRTADLDAFYGQLRSQGLAGASVHKIHTILRRALDQAVRWGWLTHNPAATAQPPKVERRPIHPPTKAEVETLIRKAGEHDPDLAAWLLLDARTGARRGELCALRWTDLDLDTGDVVIERAIVIGDGAISERPATKTRRTRRIALSAATTAALREHRRRCVERALACGVGMADDAFVFSPAPDGGRPYRPDGMTSRFATLRRSVGLDHIRLHDLRHHVATRLLTEGVDVRTVAGRLGHANPSTTLNVYAHFIPAADRRAADLLDATGD